MISPTGVDTPVWTLSWSGKAVTADIASMVTSLTVTDKKEGESDELTVELEDSDGRWRNAWMPAKGDVLDVAIGFQGGAMFDAGSFQVDDIEHSGPPDRLSVRAMAAGVTHALRTKRHRAFEGKTLPQIAAMVAADHGMTVIGDPATEPLKRISQANETDLQFLSKVAAEHGYVFSVRGKSLVFLSDEELLAADPVMTLSRSRHHPIRWRFRRTSRQVYKECEVSYQDPASKTTQKVTVKATGEAKDAGDVLKKQVRVETAAHAKQKAQALLDRANRGEIVASLSFPGRPDLVAGVNITLEGFGDAWDGKHHVVSSTHRMQRGAGYTTDVEVHRV